MPITYGRKDTVVMVNRVGRCPSADPSEILVRGLLGWVGVAGRRLAAGRAAIPAPMPDERRAGQLYADRPGYVTRRRT